MSARFDQYAHDTPEQPAKCPAKCPRCKAMEYVYSRGIDAWTCLRCRHRDR